MDKKQIIGAILLSVSVFALWAVLTAWYDKTHPLPPESAATQPATQPAGAATRSASTNPAPTSAAIANASTTNPATQAAATQAAPTITATLHAIPATQPAGPVVLGSTTQDPKTKSYPYAMGIVLDPQGASIGQITLNAFTSADEAAAAKGVRYVFQHPINDDPRTLAMSTRALVINGETVDLWNVAWTRLASDAAAATFSARIADHTGKEIVEIVKTYRLTPRAASAATGQGYEVAVEQSFRNLDVARPLHVRAILNGPTPPPSETEGGEDRSVIVGYAEPKHVVGIVADSEVSFKPSDPTKDLTLNKSKQHFVWAALSSSYFGAIVLPDPTGANQYTVSATALNPESPVDRGLSMTLQSPELTIAPGASGALPVMSVYFGPKWREVLNTQYYSAWPRMYNLLLVISSRMCAFCSFPWLITTLVAILGFFHFIVRDWGLAIICLVVLVRVVLHPITKRGQVQMMKMGKLGPEVEKLKKKYADQPEVLNKEMMKLYKQQGLPMLGCLPMFLQTPIWIALWEGLQSTFELRHAPFLYGFTWIHDLAKPDALIHFHAIALPFGFHIYALNILPLLMAVVTYVNQKYFMPMPPAATPEQASQQKMQRGMSLIFPLMFYNLPSGLNLYYLTSTSLGIIESKIVRDHIRQHEEAEKAGRVFVPIKPTRGSRRRDDRPDEAEKPKGITGRLFGAIEKMQERAEQLRRENEKKK